jgi:uncharacterized protein HemY
MILLVLLFVLAVSVLLAMLIASKVKRMLIASTNKHANAISIFAFVFSFLVIFCGIIFVLILNIGFSRGGGRHV